MGPGGSREGGSRGVWGHPVYSLYTETPNLGALHQPIASETWVNNKCIHGTGSSFWRGSWAREGSRKGVILGVGPEPKTMQNQPKIRVYGSKRGCSQG